MKRLTLGIAAAGLILAGTAIAAEQHMGSQPETRAEAQIRAEHLFDKLDLNHDGKLDQADRAIRINAMFDRLDINHDGMLSRDEFAATHPPMAPDHGMDHPGMDGRHGDGDEHPAGRIGHGGEGHRERAGLAMLILHRADPGHTGLVTRDAFVRAALALFDQADTNHDGTLTPPERRAFAQAMRQKMDEQWQHHAGPDGDSPPPPPPSGH